MSTSRETPCIFFLHGALSMEKTVTGASIMDMVCCHNVEQEVCLGFQFQDAYFWKRRGL